MKETTGAFKLRFDCIVRSSCVNLHRKYNLMVCQKWNDLTLHWLTFGQYLRYSHMSASMTLWSYWPSHFSTFMCSENIQEVRVCMLEYFLQRWPKDCTKTPLQRTNLLYIRLELLGLNYQTPSYADCTLKYRENWPKIYFLVDNSCNFEVISKSNILKQIYKKEK